MHILIADSMVALTEIGIHGVVEQIAAGVMTRRNFTVVGVTIWLPRVRRAQEKW